MYFQCKMHDLLALEKGSVTMYVIYYYIYEKFYLNIENKSWLLFSNFDSVGWLREIKVFH